MRRTGAQLLGFIFLCSSACAQENPVETYPPCVQATRHLQVPEQIHLASPGQVPPEEPPKLSFLFSEEGVDVYKLGTSSWALFVFQDEKARVKELRYLIDVSGDEMPIIAGVAWCCFETTLGRQNWKPIVSLKYATFEFGWLNLTPPGPVITFARFFAPRECYSKQTFPDTLPSSQIGNYSNMYGSSTLPRDSLAYRAALAVLGRGAKVTKPPDLVLQVAALARSWVAVDADGTPVIQNVLDRGERKTVSAYKSFDVTFDTRAVTLRLNGETLNGARLKPVGRLGVKSVHLTSADLRHSPK